MFRGLIRLARSLPARILPRRSCKKTVATAIRSRTRRRTVMEEERSSNMQVAAGSPIPPEMQKEFDRQVKAHVASLRAEIEQQVRQELAASSRGSTPAASTMANELEALRREFEALRRQWRSSSHVSTNGSAATRAPDRVTLRDAIGSLPKFSGADPARQGMGPGG